MKLFICTLISLLLPLSIASAESPAPRATGRVAFAQYCFWTGEMKLGQMEGVVRTEAGYFQGREVTLVEYDPARISLEHLAAAARVAGVADRIHLAPEAGISDATIGGVKVGEALDRSYRRAPASDQKKQLEGTPYARLRLTPEQATKVNAFCRSNPQRAAQSLTPAQRNEVAVAR